MVNGTAGEKRPTKNLSFQNPGVSEVLRHIETAGQDRNASERVEFLKGKNFLYDPKKRVIMEYGGY